MPRPCAVEVHVCRYEESWNRIMMPRPCAVEVHVSCYSNRKLWTDSSKRETPRGKPVASRKILCFLIATSVRLHGTSPWYLSAFSQSLLNAGVNETRKQT